MSDERGRRDSVAAGAWRAAKVAGRPGPEPRSLRAHLEELLRDERFGDASELLDHRLAAGAIDGALRPLMIPLRDACRVAATQVQVRHSLEAGLRDELAAEARLRPMLDELLARWDRPALFGPARIPPAGGAGPAPEPSEAVVEVQLLGERRVVVNGREIARWGSMKAQAAFDYLLLHRERPVRREILMEAFWPGYSLASARNNLNAALYSLRRTLNGNESPQFVLYASGSYRLNPEVVWRVDRDEFVARLAEARGHVRARRGEPALEAYRAAIDLHRGPFLEGAAGEWHLAERRQLEELKLQAYDEMGELHLEGGRTEEAEEVAHRALTCDSCRESAHRMLMRCYDRKQQHQMVHRQLEVCARALRRQLGIAPAPETTELVRALTRS